MSGVENKEQGALSRLSRALEESGIKVKEGSRLEKVLNENEFEAGAWDIFSIWLRKIKRDRNKGQDYTSEEYLQELQEQLSPIMENFLGTTRDE